MASRKKLGYSDHLTRIALKKMRGSVHVLFSYICSIEYIADSLPNPVNFDQEISKLKNSLNCVNCKKEIDVKNLTSSHAVIYCSEHCKQIAGTIRFVRRHIVSEQTGNYDFRIGLQERLLHLPSGGYPARARTLPKEVRTAVFERANHICQVCKKHPAQQIDHIKGSSNSPLNLQAICVSCHRVKTHSNSRPATAKEKTKILQLYESMALRIAASLPSEACDDQDNWKNIEPKLRGTRRRMVNQIIREMGEEDDANWEDTDGYVAHVMIKDN